MKNCILIFITAVLAFCLISCHKGNLTELTNDVPAALEIKPTVLASVGTRATISSFPDKSEIGLFITSGNIMNPYNGVSAYTNVKATLNINVWELNPAVYLNPMPATVFAYYPYTPENTDGTSIPIGHNTQTDYLIGTHTAGQTEINNANPHVNLSMRHALCMLIFDVYVENYTGNAELTKIEVANATGKTVLFSESKVNLQTGAITGSIGKNQAYAHSLSRMLGTTPTGHEKTLPKFMVVPVSSVPVTGDIIINFTIDGKVYTYYVPAGTIWASGTKNTYTVKLSGKALITSNITITNWTDGINGNITLP